MQNEILELLKKQLINYIVKQILGRSSSLPGIKYKVVYLIVDYFFDLYLAPVLRDAIKEGIIEYKIAVVRKKAKEYELANTQEERIDRFEHLP